MTVAAPKNGAASKRRKDDYVEISSSSSEAEPGPAPPKSVARAKAGVPRLGLPKKNERAIPTTALPPPPPQTAAPPPPIPRVPASSAAPAPSNAQRPQSPNSRTRLATYPHEARVSRTQVEQEWTLVPPSGRRILRDQVEQIAECIWDCSSALTETGADERRMRAEKRSSTGAGSNHRLARVRNRPSRRNSSNHSEQLSPTLQTS